MAKHVSDLPHALAQGDELARRLARKVPAVFLDYDGTLTPIVDRPEDAVISQGMRNAVHRLAQRCSVCVVSGRDRRVMQELMGLDDLTVAGSHGFDIWSPEGAIERGEGTEFEVLLAEVKARLHDELKMTPGKMVYEIQPKLDWDKGKAVLRLLETLGLDRDDVVPLYVGDDITDEDAFVALARRGIGIFVGRADDPEVAERTTAADYILHSTEEVRQFLDTLGR